MFVNNSHKYKCINLINLYLNLSRLKNIDHKNNRRKDNKWIN